MNEVKARIWVVEDNPSDVILLKHALKTHGVAADLDVIQDGKSAIRRLTELAAGSGPRPDLLILDINLPRHNGTEILARIAANRAFSGLPVVVMTSSDSPAEHARAHGLGADLIRKPVDLDGFLAIGGALRNLLTRNQAASSPEV